jgi:serine-type D-Ala-D-Ala carboxypeptidase
MKSDFSQADHLMKEGVERGIFPGAVLLAAARGVVVWHQAYGVADLFNGRAMHCDTVFDLASLTKPLATTLAVMLLVQQGRLALDGPCHEYWPRFRGNGKEHIAIRHLLSHTAGLPAWRPYYLRLMNVPMDRRGDLVRQWVLDEPLGAAPGERAEYSDIGFMVLQWIVERVTGERLDQFWAEAILKPLSPGSLFFSGQGPPLTAHSFAATELCPWRGRLLVGEVHDDNAHVLGGVAGHAGLFGTAHAIWSLLQGVLSSELGSVRHALFDRVILSTFFQRQFETTWALGFDTPDERGSSSGSHFSKGSMGHLGFTGTSFWMDRQRNIILVLLTNRVHPSRYSTGIKEFRPKLHDAVMSAIQGSRPQ